MVIPDVVPGNLYAISVRSLGTVGGKSFPTQPVYAERELQERGSEPRDDRPSEEKGVKGEATAAGLGLTWDEPKEYTPSGYQLYLKLSNGAVKRLTRESKSTNHLWLDDVSGFEGGEFIVTAVHPSDGSEKRVGSFVWRPTKTESKVLGEGPAMRLKATPQENGKMFVDWDREPDAVGYTLLYSVGGDGVYQLFGTLPKNRLWVLLNLVRKDKEYRFLVVAVDGEGRWLGRSAEAKGRDISELLSAPPPGEPTPTLTP
jgi:hypothetical protein